jgi:very-short-patch-repair endonuclease
MNRIYQYNKELKLRSRTLRRSQTESEKLLWYKIRSRQIGGYKFYRQFSYGSYIVDFYCPEKKLIIELDGSQHLQKTDYEKRRTEYF